MAYDEVRNQMILFGGVDAAGNYLNDTWAWDGSTWKLLAPAHRPSARIYHAMTWNAQAGNVVLFGGWSSAALNDTWIWDGADWIQKFPPVSPPSRVAGALVFDYWAQPAAAVALYGGTDYVTYFDDTWHWNGTTWSEVTLPAAKYAPARSNPAYAISPGRHPFAVGGWSSSGTVLNDFWLLEDEVSGNGTWASAAFPYAARTDAAAARDPWRRGSSIATTIVYGGSNSSGILSDTIAYDGYGWSALQSATPAPGPRRYHAMAYDTAGQQTMLFGGLDAAGTATADTWLLTGLKIKKSAPATAKSGDVITYTLLYRNAGASVSGTTITDVIAPGTRLVAVNDNGVQTGDTITWNLGTLLPSSTWSAVSYSTIVDQTSGTVSDENLSDPGLSFGLHFGSYSIQSTDGYRTVGPPVSVQIAVAPATPGGVAATAQSVGSVVVTWAAVPNTASYEVYRRAAGGTYVRVATVTAPSWNDAPPAGAAYLYRVRAVNQYGSSPDSLPDLATTVVFTSFASGDIVRATHLAELRSGVNAVRALAGLGLRVYTDAATPGVTIRSAHVTELRSALDEAFVTLGLTAAPYTAGVAAGQPIRAIHFRELRDRLQ